MKEIQYDKRKYERDFPEQGYWNWKTIRIIMPDDVYYHNAKITGVVLHDGNFLTNGVMFLKENFEIIDENPLRLNKNTLMNEKEAVRILGEQIGYGNMMHLASECWKEAMIAKGYPTSGVFVPKLPNDK